MDDHQGTWVTLNGSVRTVLRYYSVTRDYSQVVTENKGM